MPNKIVRTADDKGTVMSANMFSNNSTNWELDGLPKIRQTLPKVSMKGLEKDQNTEFLFDDIDIVDLADRIDGFFNSIG